MSKPTAISTAIAGTATTPRAVAMRAASRIGPATPIPPTRPARIAKVIAASGRVATAARSCARPSRAATSAMAARARARTTGPARPGLRGPGDWKAAWAAATPAARPATMAPAAIPAARPTMATNAISIIVTAIATATRALYGDHQPYRSFRGDGAHRPRHEERTWFDRARDEVSSWMGDQDALHRRQADGEHRGRGPKGYRRSDERIREDVSDRLTDDSWLDAHGVEVSVSDGDVTLSGTVRSARGQEARRSPGRERGRRRQRPEQPARRPRDGYDDVDRTAVGSAGLT
ncbi:BON domain-containing protein [Caulobacter segnis]